MILIKEKKVATNGMAKEVPWESLDFEEVFCQALRQGGDFAEIYLEETSATLIICEDHRMEKISSEYDRGAGIRIFSEGKAFYAYGTDTSPEGLSKLASTLPATSKSRAPGPGPQIITSKSIDDHSSRGAVFLPGNLGSKVDIVQRADEAAWDFSPHLCQVKVLLRDRQQKVMVANTRGTAVQGVRHYTSFMTQAVARQKELLQTGIETAGSTIGLKVFDERSPEEIARCAAQRAVLMLNASPVQGGRMPVVLSSQAGGTMIHEAIGHGLEADLAQEGLSVYSQRMGELVASPQITVIDDATISDKFGTYLFDDEGVEGQRIVLVENGTLKNYLYDMLSATKHGACSTGNGRRQSYRYQPIPRMTNTFIAPGTSSPEEILRTTPTGLYVVKMGGGEVNTVNGDFVFEVNEGYRIENGKIGEPVRGATLIGNGPEILKQIDRVGNDLGFGIGVCGKDGQGAPVSDAQPTIRIPEMVVGGAVS